MGRRGRVLRHEGTKSTKFKKMDSETSVSFLNFVVR